MISTDVRLFYKCVGELFRENPQLKRNKGSLTMAAEKWKECKGNQIKFRQLFSSLVGGLTSPQRDSFRDPTRRML